jgi:hypothetical protein
LLLAAVETSVEGLALEGSGTGQGLMEVIRIVLELRSCI